MVVFLAAGIYGRRMDLRTSLASVLRSTDLKLFASARERISPAWVEAACAERGGVSVRSRKLPPEVVVWTVVGASLFSHLNFAEVVGHLGLTAPTRRGTPQAAPRSSSIAAARSRLGSDALAAVTRTAARAWLQEEDVPQFRIHGLRVMGVDGTTLCTPDTQENLEAFGRPPTGEGQTPAAFPQVKVLSLVELHTHLVMDAELGPFRSGELPMMEAMLPRVPDHTLLVLDRGFRSWAMLHALHSKGVARHWLLRATASPPYPLVEELGVGDRLVALLTSRLARKEHPDLPEKILAREVTYRVKNTTYRLLTSLLDPQMFPAATLARLYHARWEVELAFDDIKTEQRGASEHLRSRKADGVRQEVWALLLAHNLVRSEMARAAALAGLPPNRFSFHGALQLVGHHLQVIVQGTAPTKIADREWRLREALISLVLPERRPEREYPRSVKRVLSRYPRKRAFQPTNLTQN